MRIGIVYYHGDLGRMLCEIMPSGHETVVYPMSEPLEALPDVDVVLNHHMHEVNRRTKCPYIAVPYGSIRQEHVDCWNDDPRCAGVVDVSSSLCKRFVLRKPAFSFMPFYPGLPTYPEAGTEVICLVNDYARRFPTDQAFAASVTGHLYGTPDNPVNDVAKLKDARWLLHVKPEGFVCNAVMKALACGVPVILDDESWRKGFLTEIVRHDHNGIVLPRDRIARFLETCGAAQYDRIKRTCVKEADKYKNTPRPCQAIPSWLESAATAPAKVKPPGARRFF